MFIETEVHLVFETKLGLVGARSQNFKTSFALLETALLIYSFSIFMKIEALFNFGTKLCLTVGTPNSVLENFFIS